MQRPIPLLVSDIFSRLGWRTPLLILVMAANGLAEGLALMLLFPLLRLITGTTPSPLSFTNRITAAALNALGFSVSFTHVLVFALCVFVLQNAAAVAEGWLAARYRSQYASNWRTELFNAILEARWNFFVAQKAAKLTNALLDEIPQLSGGFYNVTHIVADAIFVLVYLTVAVIAIPQIAVGILVFGVAMSLLIRPLMRHGSDAGIELMRANETLHFMASELIRGAKLLKATASEPRASHLFSSLVEKMSALQRTVYFHPKLIRSLYELAGILALVASLWIGIAVLKISAIDIMIIVFLFTRIATRISQLQQHVHSLQASYAPSIIPATTMLWAARSEREPVNAEQAPIVVDGSRGIGFRLCNISVQYDKRFVLSGVTLAVPAASMLGIAGPSGAGKSTLVDCILGLVTPETGSVEINGQSLVELPLRAWRQMVGYVAQDTFLFNASIRENICWAHPSATEVEIERAARQAHADTFIRALPQGYDTEVGDRGVRLSGGERQRIGLARALLGPTRLLVLDEATSALDSESERVVLDAVAELRGKMTVVIIAHRLSTLRNADMLCLLENGKVVETGRWDELIRPGTRFHDFWELQSDQHPAFVPS